jgi:hypothetical protein
VKFVPISMFIVSVSSVNMTRVSEEYNPLELTCFCTSIEIQAESTSLS